MRWHNNTLEGIFEGLNQTFLQGRYSDQVVEKLLRKNKKIRQPLETPDTRK